jgi:hypothetical protein
VLGALAGLAGGCNPPGVTAGGSPPVAVPLPPLLAPSVDPAFANADAEYAAALERLGRASEDRYRAALDQALLRLADALDRVPTDVPEEAGVADASALLRSQVGDVALGVHDGSPPAEPTKRALAVAARALFRVVQRSYPDAQPVAEAVARFARAVDAIDPTAAPPAHRAAVQAALDAAKRALRAIEGASVMP